MLLILFSWCYILFTTLNLGFTYGKIAKLKCYDFVVLVFLGLFSTTILASIWAIFGRINVEFHLFLVLLNGILYFKYKLELQILYHDFFKEIKAISKQLKIFLFLIFVLILMQCASPSFFIDNENYYVQTIKWLNEYGFVKGLANLHFFLGQTSGWHIAQSAFNFSFLYPSFNDLNGFCLLLLNLFAVLKLNTFQENKNKVALIIGILPLANLLFFQFISVPSPDLAVYILSFVLIYYFLEYFQSITAPIFNLIVVLALFIVYIKITAMPILLLPIVILLFNFRELVSKITISYILGTLVLGLFIVKNLILTGYPFFPSLYLKEYITIDYAVPFEMYTFYFNKAKLYDFVVTETEYYNLDSLQIISKCLFHSRMDSVFNSGIVILFFAVPVFLWCYYNKKPYWMVYLTMTVQLLFLLLSSPQYRFILHYVLFFGFLLFSYFIKKVKIIIPLFFLSSIPIVLLLFFPIKNKILSYQYNSISLKNGIVPSKNSNLKTNFYPVKMGNLTYFSPDRKTYFWTTGNGNLPCLNTKQLLYLKDKLGYIPQQRTSNLADGFYSMPFKNGSN
ncbi:LIC_10190 family membrane protein [Flavobacterium psychrotolerans]|uniref:DUF8201 domain-containing protein n=1 Tax=Flavobacterium psychrotolerans TaxID=2169410 RepID=A0A2U1JIP0_9FLAO|nr:hypothetical protein [Flavobacterium psychrotolerans]PWA05040.1 hypothetical protein DB895_08385 [Flavobacterium psychrotolerans]